MQDHAYPRPQLRRSNWVSLNGPWRFAFEEHPAIATAPTSGNWPMVIQVPFAPESERSGVYDRSFHRACWYERDVDLPEDARAPGHRVLLHFGAVDYSAQVWVNDSLVAEHYG